MSSSRPDGGSRAESPRLQSAKEEFIGDILNKKLLPFAPLSTWRGTEQPHAAASPSPPKPNRSGGSVDASVRSARHTKPRPVNWHQEIYLATQSKCWGHLEDTISRYMNKTKDRQQRTKKQNFWRFFPRARHEDEVDISLQDSLLLVDRQGRTPLHSAMTARLAPPDVLVALIRAAPRACGVRTHNGRYPLHFAVLARRHIRVIAALVDAFPQAVSALDFNQQSPFTYAFDMAKRTTSLEIAPSTFWMAADDSVTGGAVNTGILHAAVSIAYYYDQYDELSEQSPLDTQYESQGFKSPRALWQEKQTQVWSVVHCLLLSLQSHALEQMNVNENRKPLLMDALLYAAPPAVVALLVGASERLMRLGASNHRASAVAGSALYTGLARHYPLEILQSLTALCPRDVRTVRDETGMGLVSAHFISACFQQSRVGEWHLNNEFVDMLMQVTITERLPTHDAGFREWWAKMEYLILNCGCEDEHEYKLLSMSKEYLLQAALANQDVPPIVIQLLLALYPSSIQHAHPQTCALPIHTAAICAEYIPRNYEFLMMDCGFTTMELIVNADPSAIHERQDDRLPLHMALDVGKRSQAIRILLKESMADLSIRDSVTGLFPFMQAAMCRHESRNVFRWNCLARNKYSNAVWKGLNERQKRTAIMRVAEYDEIERLDTINMLLRSRPTAVEASRPFSATFHGPGAVLRKHYIWWCYDQYGDNDWMPNMTRLKIMERAIAIARQTNSLNDLNAEDEGDFAMWWHTMKFWIRYCASQYVSRIYMNTTYTVKDSEEYLLHAALINSENVHPDVVELLVALYPKAVKLLTTEDSLLPLHIACLEQSYTPFQFENTRPSSSLELILQAYPEAASVPLIGGRFALHMALRSGKEDNILIALAEHCPQSLKIPDVDTQLYPFQVAALKRPYSKQQIRELERVTMSFNDDASDWDLLPTKQRATNVRKVQKSFERMHVTCIFALLRREPSICRTHSVVNRTAFSPNMYLDHYKSATLKKSGFCLGSLNVVSAKDKLDVVAATNLSGSFDTHRGWNSSSESADESECCAYGDIRPTERTMLPSTRPGPKSSDLIRLLTRDHATHTSGAGANLIGCDHSVFSDVDVMSTLSTSYHSKSKQISRKDLHKAQAEETESQSHDDSQYESESECDNDSDFMAVEYDEHP